MSELVPAAFDKGLLRRIKKLGCVIDVSAFEANDGELETCRQAISQTFGPDRTDAILFSVSPRKLRERKFFGDWLNLDTGKLIKRGTYKNDAGDELIDPTMEKLFKFGARSSACEIPDAGSGGQFAYAFLCPPYSLRGSARSIQETFDELRWAILPNDTENEILDWTSPILTNFSAYFKVGMEWWGIFLFTIFSRSRRRLIVLSASTTD